jgi:hypothetical protein
MAIFALAAVISLAACSDDSNDPSDGNDLYETWTRFVTEFDDTTFNARLVINDDNSYDFVVVDDVEGHTDCHAKFHLNGSTIEIYEDADCGGTGEYTFSINDDVLTIQLVSDNCSPRAKAIAGVWHEVED